MISEVGAPSKPDQHKADLYIEAMEIVSKADIPAAVRMMRQLEKSSSTHPGDPSTSSEVAWEQRKCRRLNRYPTLTRDATEHPGRSGMALLQSVLQRIATDRRMLGGERHSNFQALILHGRVVSRQNTYAASERRQYHADAR